MNLVPSTHPALWTVAEPITDFDAALAIAQELLDLVITYHGAGLAAPQIGVSQRLFVMREGPTFFTVINPVILNHGRDEEVETEGCLSFPGQHVSVKRWRVIDVEYHNGVKTVRRTLKGMAARVFLHELDHLNGICLLPRPQDAS